MKRNSGIKRILTIAGSDSGGGAGIQADLKTIAALGGYGMSVITALTAQNTTGVQGVFEVPVSFIEKQFDSVASDIGVDAAKTGMLATGEIIAAVAKKLRKYRIRKVVVDPVMVAKGGSRLLAAEAEEALKQHLLPLALVVTPNIPEAEAIAGMRIRSAEEMKKAAEAIWRMGPRSVLVKGGHLGGEALDILYDGKTFHEFSSPRIQTSDTHGTGCTLASAVAACIAFGLPLPEAVARAKEFVTEAIRGAFRIGRSHGPTNHMAALFRDAGRHQCLEELKRAFDILKGGGCAELIPEVQSNLGYALPGASSPEEVAAFPGRIIRCRGAVASAAPPEFGASSHIARIILTAMKYGPGFRSAMNIRYSPDIVRACKSLGFAVDSFSRAEEPKRTKSREGSSLEWGTDSVLARRRSIPDIIFDKGDLGKEPMVRVLGRHPLETAEKVLRICAQLNTKKGEKK